MTSSHYNTETTQYHVVSFPDHTLYASSESLVSYVDFLGPEAISLENGRLKSDWSLLNKYVILTHHDS